MARPDTTIIPIEIPFNANALIDANLPLFERAIFFARNELRDGNGIGGRRNAQEAHLALPGVQRIDDSGVRALIGLQRELVEEQRLKLVLHVPESIGPKLEPFGIDFRLIAPENLEQINYRGFLWQL